MQNPAPSTETLLRDPAWLPHYYDVNSDALLFAYLPREFQRKATFIDPRIGSAAPQAGLIPLSTLPTAQLAAEARPLHFIFHTAFCCSTLLARALDIPGVCMGVKEPAILVAFANAWSAGRDTPQTRAALSTSLDLLARPLSAGEAQIVKPSNVANMLAGHILETRPTSRAIVMYSPLEPYLLAVARKGHRGRAFARSMLHHFLPTIPLGAEMPARDLLRLTDLQIAALIWLMQMKALGAVASRFGGDRVRTLNGDTLVARSSDAMTRAGSFLQLNATAETMSAIGAGPVFGEDAKNLGARFDPTARRRELDRIAAQHADEIGAAVQWAQALAAQTAAPLTLGDTLLS